MNDFTIDDEKYFLDFENMHIESTDSLSPLRQALILYHDLLAFHKQRADTAAYVNLELERINLIADQSNFDQSDTLRKQAFTRLRDNYRSHPASALAIFELASVLQKEGSEYINNKRTGTQFKIADALALCNEAISLFPASDGARKCEGLRSLILHKGLSLVSEKYVPIEKPSFFSIDYANVDSLFISVYPITPELEQHLNDNVRDDSTTWSQIARLPADLRWNVKLKNVHDYQSHTTEVVLPALAQGNYVIVATPVNDYSYEKDLFAYGTIQVTNLSLLEYASKQEHHYRVVDRNNGMPIAGADVHVKSRYDDGGNARIDEHLTTKKDGEATLRKRQDFAPALTATVRYSDDEASFGDYYMQPLPEKGGGNESRRAHSFLFTDRSIYRPGQVVFFKGILIKTKGDKSSVVPGQYIVVYLEDVNDKEVGSLRLKTNAFGSVSGQFTLPSTGLTGEYTLYADEDDEGDSRFYDDLDDFDYDEHVISVEEYKRPTFEVTFDPVRKTFALNDSVSVTGVAEAYNGSAISGSKVTYRVTRNVRYPRWSQWGFDRDYSEAAEIAHGETVTGKSGGFSIKFRAVPDIQVSPDHKPVFVYELKANITDINGETRSAATDVKVGYHTVIATINAAAQVDAERPENVIGLTTENLNGQFVPLKGKVQIYKLKGPDGPIRKRPWEAPDLPLLTEQQFKELFPYDSYSPSADPNTWPKEKLFLELPFDTQHSKDLKYSTDASWPLGHYRIELTALDSAGRVVNDYYDFNLIDSRSKLVPDNALVIFELDKPAYNVGEVARLRVGSASSDVTLFIHVEKNNDVTKTYVEHFSGNIKTILLPVTDEKEGGFSVSCSGAAYNSFIYRAINIPVIRPSQQFEIETLTFKDKIQTGAKQTWSFSIKGPDSSPAEAEVLA
ncbi:MAG TPA: MG2 domain-containing protein, partial [Chryseosolibacter sp.]|nr:MG2 domain-containing protein [Chryseosolibacter sp.]